MQFLKIQFSLYKYLDFMVNSNFKRVTLSQVWDDGNIEISIIPHYGLIFIFH